MNKWQMCEQNFALSLTKHRFGSPQATVFPAASKNAVTATALPRGRPALRSVSQSCTDAQVQKWVGLASTDARNTTLTIPSCVSYSEVCICRGAECTLVCDTSSVTDGQTADCVHRTGKGQTDWITDQTTIYLSNYIYYIYIHIYGGKETTGET